ncbi:hypothetical protein BKA93DRAFT_830325 [Sparassis latifolia]
MASLLSLAYPQRSRPDRPHVPPRGGSPRLFPEGVLVIPAHAREVVTTMQSADERGELSYIAHRVLPSRARAKRLSSAQRLPGPRHTSLVSPSNLDGDDAPSILVMTLPSLTHNRARRTRPTDTLLSTSTSVPPPLDRPTRPTTPPHPTHASTKRARTSGQPSRESFPAGSPTRPRLSRHGQGPGQLTPATAFPGRRDQAGWRQWRGLLVVSGRPDCRAGRWTDETEASEAPRKCFFLSFACARPCALGWRTSIGSAPPNERFPEPRLSGACFVSWTTHAIPRLRYPPSATDRPPRLGHSALHRLVDGRIPHVDRNLTLSAPGRTGTQRHHNKAQRPRFAVVALFQASVSPSAASYEFATRETSRWMRLFRGRRFLQSIRAAAVVQRPRVGNANRPSQSPGCRLNLRDSPGCRPNLRDLAISERLRMVRPGVLVVPVWRRPRLARRTDRDALCHVRNAPILRCRPGDGKYILSVADLLHFQECTTDNAFSILRAQPARDITARQHSPK